MSHDLVSLGSSSGLPARLERQLSRELATIQARGVVAAARESARVEAIAEVAETALLAVSHVSALEALLINRTPHAMRRLEHIADSGSAGIADVVLRAGRRKS